MKTSEVYQILYKSIVYFFISIFILSYLPGQDIYSFAASDGEMLHYSKYGKGEVIVFLYGGPGYAVSAMKPWADSLAGKFQCILYDQRGTGLSAKVKLDTSTINLKRAVQDLEDLRIHLKQNQLTLCGISWGGMLAQTYAAHFPEKTGKIILVSTIGPNLETASSMQDNLNMRRFPHERDSLQYWRKQEINDHVRMKRSFFTFLPEFFDHKKGQEKLKLFFASTTYHRKMGDLMGKDIGKHYDLTQRLPQYKGDCIIIRPRQDPIPAEAIFQIKHLLPQTKIYWIEKCGHFPDYEQPEKLFSILRRVL